MRKIDTTENKKICISDKIEASLIAKTLEDDMLDVERSQYKYSAFFSKCYFNQTCQKQLQSIKWLKGERQKKIINEILALFRACWQATKILRGNCEDCEQNRLNLDVSRCVGADERVRLCNSLRLAGERKLSLF